MAESADDVAARLRQKIRSQAAELLLKVDMVKSGGSSSGGGSPSSPYGASRTARRSITERDEERSTISSSYNKERRSSSLIAGGAAEDEHEASQYHHQSPHEPSSPASSHHSRQSVPSSSSGAAGNNSLPSVSTPLSKNRSESSSELTKRLQRLALERQKETQKDRLRVIQADKSSHLSSVKTFQELPIPKHLLEALFHMGFDRPSAIQEEALPRILANPPRNVIAQAQSGSGKTTCFTLGMLYRIEINTPAVLQALCVTPTRELAIQVVEKSVQPMSALMDGLKIQLAISKTTLESAKTKGVDAHLVVGTPGKIVDWMKRKFLDPTHIKVFVLDEADHMVGEGGHRANSLLMNRKVPPTCQRLLFSATFPPDVIEFASKVVDNPDKILLAEEPENLVLDVIKQLWIDTREYQGHNGVGSTKLEFLADIYSLLTIGQSIVFVSTQNEANLVHQTLGDAGYTCSVLHAGVEADQRDDTMQQFRNGESNVLITTNVLARGVDVDNVCLVVNYTVPLTVDGNPDYETYLHRIGRTGRFGRKGTSITLIDSRESMHALAAIEAHFSGKSYGSAVKDGVVYELIQKAPADPEALAELIEI